ncbi:hypothetical protein [Caenimonas sp. SL110]|uniref:hypothetical protein n=1 Tax=Caenimonas sp. SL110 TaxID=1450524 RepID=UPI0009E241B4|nr:hypothetical protein [Caenimonas sp. SL110]
MQSGQRDVAQIRLDNAMALFEEFVHHTVKHPDAATLRGLERRFAERLQIQPSYWSQIKGRSRQIGERLARQFEQLTHKPVGWMDVTHDASGTRPLPASSPARVATPAAGESPLPQDDDERFIVGLVLTYYRRHPQRARTRLLDLLGEVLMPGAAGGAPAAATAVTPASPVAPAAQGPRPAAPTPSDDPSSLWQRTQQGVAPLKRKR